MANEYSPAEGKLTLSEVVAPPLTGSMVSAFAGVSVAV